ncbi:MAG: hypothetical protein KTR25_09715 [Myxococcales bacterium]|nr:hypothetical protein [Myxococcales bacterium]
MKLIRPNSLGFAEVSGLSQPPQLLQSIKQLFPRVFGPPFAWLVFAGLTTLLSSIALGGEVRTQASLDYFYAESEDDNPPPGINAKLSAQELGMRLRIDFFELNNRLEVHVDYRGREPLDGDIKNDTLRLLYRGELQYQIVKKTLTAAIGRFIAPAALFLPVDGLRIEYNLSSDWLALAYFGRRAISTSRRNLDFDRFRPAAGGLLRYSRPWINAEIAGSYAEDKAILIKGSQDKSQERRRNYDNSHFYARATLRPNSRFMVGGQLSFMEQARYILGPGWADAQIDVNSTDIWSANFFADFRPIKGTQADYSFHYQKATSYRAALVDEAGVLDEDQAPEFLDNRIQLGWRPLNLGWIRVRGRWRIRPDRQEYRIGGSIRVDRLGLKGLYAKGRVLYEDIVFDDDVVDPPNLDRIRWAAGAGYQNSSLNAQAGVRLIDRYGARVSGRQSDGQANNIVDLNPFTLQTQRVAYLQLFYNQRSFFAGIDWEQNIEDNEFRFFIQSGAFVETSW